MDERRKLDMALSQAQLEEKAARESGDRAGVRDAQDKASNIVMEMQRHDYVRVHGDDKDVVVLVSPNERANLTDSNGVQFVDGRAQVPRAMAVRYLELDGYSIEEA